MPKSLDGPDTSATDDQSRADLDSSPWPGSAEDGSEPPGPWHGPDNTRRWVFATGGVTVVAITVAALLILNMLTHARNDLDRVVAEGIPAQNELVTLRSSVFDFQSFIEVHLDQLAPGTAPSTSTLATGVQIVQRMTTTEVTLARTLRRIGMSSDAADFDAAITTFTAATTKLTPIAAGQVVSTAVRVAIVAAERAALSNLWSLSTTIGQRISIEVTQADAANSLKHLRLARTAFLVAVAADVMFVLAVAMVFGVRAGNRERARRRNARRQSYELRLQRALDMTASESAVFDILGTSLHQSTPGLQVEMLIAESSRAHFRRALSSAGEFEGCGVVSPVDCPAATSGQTQLFPSSDALDACPYLKSRASGSCSAVCNPVSIAGLTIGVVHAVGPDGSLPDAADMASLQFSTRRGTERIAMLRAFAASEEKERIDALTGLLNRHSLERRVQELRGASIPYALAYGAIDHFNELTDTHGYEAGDQALRLFARVLRDSVRPDDISARSGNDDFIVVLPECSPDVAIEVLERVRDRLVLALTAGRVPAFTATFGVASTAYASEFDEIVAVADNALLVAQATGRDRVVLATFADNGARPVEHA